LRSIAQAKFKNVRGFEYSDPLYMSVEVQNLTKIYHLQKALDNISFTAPQGEITCFLGPNGAGKSTTMKIAVGYIMPTSGQVKVNGLTAAASPLKVKKMIGYLPEHNPLYLEMYVREFLAFIAGAYGIKGTNAKMRVEEMIELCGLEKEQHKKIVQLSKGYRQRVGLAKALLPDPEVLILDEPTTGLDPNQIVEIRQLIKQVSQQKTVILSTHIMQEVEALASRVVIINRGKLVADDSLANLKQAGQQAEVLEVVFDAPVDADTLKQIKGVEAILELKRGVFHITGEGQVLRREIMRVAAERDLPLASVTPVAASLETIFQQLTHQSS
jgi:ABC-2 type transport system ATP-binding protein